MNRARGPSDRSGRVVVDPLRWLRRTLRRRLDKPQYLYRPQQIVARLRYSPGAWGADDTTIMKLPWGVDLECFPADVIGSSIGRTGIYDLLVTEALLRLVDVGELAVDAGANVGYTSAVLARAAGPGGRVVAVEPQPQVFALLERNATRWRTRSDLAPVELRRVGLAASAGDGVVIAPPGFSANRGTSVTVARSDGDGDPIALVALDDIVGGPIGVLKLDVEGRELDVLRGTARLLAAGAIRDLVFEENAAYPTPVTDLLEGCGYTIRGLRQRLSGPRLSDPQASADRLWDPPLLLATRDAPRLARRFARRGWRAL